MSDLTTGQVIKKSQCRVDQQDEPEHIVHLNDISETEHAENMRLVDDQSGAQQDQDGAGLQPMPEPFVTVVHVDRPGGSRLAGMPQSTPALEVVPRQGMSGNAQRNSEEHQQAKLIHQIEAMQPYDVEAAGTAVGNVGNTAIFPADNLPAQIEPDISIGSVIVVRELSTRLEIG